MWRLARVERIGEGLMRQHRAEERGRRLVDARGGGERGSLREWSEE